MELESPNEKGSAMHMTDKMEKLKDRDTRIVDSGATSHNTTHVAGFCDVKEQLQIDSVTIGTGDRFGATKAGTIKGSICDKFDNILIKNVILKDAVVVPE